MSTGTNRATPRQTFEAALAEVRRLKAAAAPGMSKTSGSTKVSERSKLSAIKGRNEEIHARATYLSSLGERGLEKVSFERVATNSYDPYTHYSSRDALIKISGGRVQAYTQEGQDSLATLTSMDVLGPDDALAVFQKTSSRVGVPVNELAYQLGIIDGSGPLYWRKEAAMKLSEEQFTDDIARAKDAVQSVVKAKGELPSAIDIADAANVSPLAANVAVHETAELIASVGGQVASADIPMSEDPGAGGPEMMGGGEAMPADPGMMDPNMMDPNMMDPNMLPPQGMDPNMMPPQGADPNMMPPQGMDPNMMPPEQGMEAQASMDDRALERMITKIAEDILAQELPLERSERPASDNTPRSVGGKTAATSKREGLDIFSRSSQSKSHGLTNVLDEDISGTLELDAAHLSADTDTSVGLEDGPVKSAEYRRLVGSVDDIFRKSAEDEDADLDEDDFSDLAEEVDDEGDDSESTDESITEWVKKYLKENSQYPSVDAVTEKFDISSDRADEILEEVAE